MAKSHDVHKARLVLEEAIRAMFDARREVFAPWGECTSEARYYRDLEVRSFTELREAAEELRRLAWRLPGRRKKGLWPVFWRLERAWAHSHAALDGWIWARSVLKNGDAALERVRGAVNTLFQ